MNRLLLYLSMVDGPTDKERFSRLYYKYRRIMFHAAKDILGSSSDAEDVLQEAFIKVTKNMKKFGEIDCPETRNFLVIIVRRTSLDYLRKHHRNASIPIEDVEDTLSNEITSEESVENQESLEAVKDCIKQLPQSYSDILVLKYFDGLSNKEIGNYLNISQDNVYKLLQRAKAALELKLKKNGDENNDF